MLLFACKSVDFAKYLREHGPRLSLGQLDEEQKERIYGALEELQIDLTLEDGRTLSFLAPLYLQAVAEGKHKARENIEALAMQIGGTVEQKENGAKAGTGVRNAEPGVRNLFAGVGRGKTDMPETRRPVPARIQAIEEKAAAKRMLTVDESRAVLEYRNKTGHQERVRAFGPVPDGEITNLVITCADARMAGAVEYEDFIDGTRILYVAGNIADVLARPEMAPLLEKLKKGATITVLGHTFCGAVACACHAQNYQALDNIPNLLKKVHPGGERENVMQQVEAVRAMEGIRQRIGDGTLRVAGMLLHLEDQAVEPVHGKGRVLKVDREFARQLEQKFRQKNLDQDLAQDQFAHAVVVSGSQVRVSGREIFDCAQANRVFCVSASDTGPGGRPAGLDLESVASAEMAMLDLLDGHALASVQYTILKNATPHVVLVHPDERVLAAWEREMLQKSPIIKKAVQDGTVVIDRYRYDEKTGEALRLQG